MRPFSKGRRESEVQAGVTAYLNTRTDCYWWRQNTGAARFNDFFVRFGIKGASDFIGVQARLQSHGRMFAIETKREIGGELSEDQELFRDNIQRFGGLYVVARSVDEVQLALGEPQVRLTKVMKTRGYAR